MDLSDAIVGVIADIVDSAHRAWDTGDLPIYIFSLSKARPPEVWKQFVRRRTVSGEGVKGLLFDSLRDSVACLLNAESHCIAPPP